MENTDQFGEILRELAILRTEHLKLSEEDLQLSEEFQEIKDETSVLKEDYHLLQESLEIGSVDKTQRQKIHQDRNDTESKSLLAEAIWVASLTCPTLDTNDKASIKTYSKI